MTTWRPGWSEGHSNRNGENMTKPKFKSGDEVMIVSLPGYRSSVGYIYGPSLAFHTGVVSNVIPAFGDIPLCYLVRVNGAGTWFFSARNLELRP